MVSSLYTVYRKNYKYFMYLYERFFDSNETRIANSGKIIIVRLFIWGDQFRIPYEAYENNIQPPLLNSFVWRFNDRFGDLMDTTRTFTLRVLSTVEKAAPTVYGKN